MRGLGTAVNVATVLAGSAIGVALGGRVPERLRATTLAGIGLLTLGVGAASFLETTNAVFPVVALVLGAIVGEGLRIEQRLQGLGERLRRWAERRRAQEPGGRPTRFVEGFVTATLTFCVGALTIVGSLQDGISGDAQLLLVKSALDGLVAVVYAAAFGWGVAFSVLSIVVLQGSLTVVGTTAGEALLDERMVAELEATGGVLILGIGLRLLDLKAVPVASYLPSLAVAPALVALFGR